MGSPCIKQTVCKVLKIFQHGKYLVAYVLNVMAFVIFTEITTAEDAMPSLFYLGVINLIKILVSDTARHRYSPTMTLRQRLFTHLQNM